MAGEILDALGLRVVTTIAWLLRPLYSRILRDDDTETQRIRKIAFSTVAAALIIAIPIHVGATLLQGEGGDGHELYFMWCGIAAVLSVGVIVYLLRQQHASDCFCHAALVVYSTVILLVDMHSMTAMSFNRGITVFVVLLDVVILSRVNPVFYLSLIAVWLCFTEAELAFRYGLLDLPLTVPAEVRRERMCNCESPPCATSVSNFLRTSVIVMFVFVLDYALTRRFAKLARQEKEKVEAAVHTTHRIADCFARFDLDRASDILTSSDELPDDLAHALGTVLDNLTRYKPYLPSAFFMKSGADADIDVSVPGWNGAGVAMVFTDIRQSTALWEHNAGAMKAALEVHNRIMRGGIASYDGYEVKTIGDAFMAAFPSAAAAVRFGLGVQEALAGTVWPEGLGRGARDDHDVLMVRIGVHVGEASLEVNPATGRYDYFGSTVNKTARVEANGAAGAVTVTPEVMEAVWTARVLEEAQVVPYADLRFAKGFAAGLRLTALVPSGAAEQYMNVVKAHCAEQQVVSDSTLRQKQRMSMAVSDAHFLSVCTPESSDSVSLASSMSMASSAMCVRPTRSSPRNGPSSAAARVSCGSVCFVRLPSPSALATLGACLAQGSLSTVVGNFAVVSWGAHRAMPDHYRHAVAFVAALRSTLRGEDDARFHAGLASGLVTSGHVAATAAQRFVTISGACVDLSVMLCAGAAELEACVLAGSLDRSVGVRAEGIMQGVCARPVDTWQALVDARRMSCSRTLRTRSSLASVGADLEEHLGEVLVHELAFRDTTPADEEYRAAYARGDIATMRALAAHDPTLARACRMLEHGQHLSHALCSCCVGSGAGVPGLKAKTQALLRVDVRPESPSRRARLRRGQRTLSVCRSVDQDQYIEVPEADPQ